MSGHTKEPWFDHDLSADPIDEPRIFDSEGMQVAHVYEWADFSISRHDRLAIQAANARRIVACVNACAPIETSELEEITRTGGLLGPRDDIARLAAQRDDLFAAAFAAETVLARQKWREDGTDPEAVALRLLRKAIAKAEVTP